MASMKEDLIREYISNINFKSDDWKISEIEKNMRSFLGEEPGVSVAYRKDFRINEIIGKAQEVLEPDTIDIVFFDLDESYKKLSFRLD